MPNDGSNVEIPKNLKLELAVKRFVEKNSNISDIAWDSSLKAAAYKLPLNPYAESSEEKSKVAHYFLLVSATLEDRLVDKSENARKLMVFLWSKFSGIGLFEVFDPEILHKKIEGWKSNSELGKSKDLIPDILVEVNRFVKVEAKGDLVKYSESLGSPQEFVDRIGQKIETMRDRYKDKVWVYLRWMMRRHPDLRVFSLSQEDLQVPMTGNIVNVAVSLGWIPKPEHPLWQDLSLLDKSCEEVTRNAKRLFKDDPVKIDYPFFMLGRLLKGKPLDNATLEHVLDSLEDIEKVTGHPHSFYHDVGRRGRGWEDVVANTLKKLNIQSNEQVVFPLSKGIPTYTADFVLDKFLDGRKIVLEPHYDLTERDCRKFTVFREDYGQKYFLVLLMKNDDIPFYRRRNLLTDEVCDDVWPFEDVDVLLKNIRDKLYHPL